MSFFSDLGPEISSLPADDLKSWFAGARSKSDNGTQDQGLLLQEAAVRIAETQADAARFLRSCIAQADDEKLAAILLGLYYAAKKLPRQERGDVISLVQTYLDDARPRIVAEAVDTLNHLDCVNLWGDIAKLANHPSPMVVGSFLRFMAKHFPAAAVPVLEQALDSPEPIVRENAVDELDDLEHVAALPKIKRLLEDSDENVRQAAQYAVAHLEGASEIS